jgi:hypothetical protein
LTRPVRPKSLPAHGGFAPRHWAGLSPYGLGRQKPDHFGEMAKTAWQNRRALPYAWRILTQGVCDGCALGTTGLSDWTMQGVHLCTVRLNLLHLNTMGPLDPAHLADAARCAARRARSCARSDACATRWRGGAARRDSGACRGRRRWTWRPSGSRP